MKSTEELKLFLVKNNSMVFPIFYVEAIDILEATKVAKEIVDNLNSDRVIGTVSAVDIPLLRLGEE